MINTRKFAAAILCLWLWGGCFLPMVASAYGGGTQEEKYPQVIPSQDFMDLATAKLEEELANIGEARRHTFELVKTPPVMHCPSGDLVCEVTLPKQLRYSGVTPVYVTAFVDGKPFRRVICHYRVHVYGEVLVAAHDLLLDKAITAADVRREEREIKDRSDVYLIDVTELEGQVPARIIKEGTPITANMLQTPIVVQSGAPVTLVSHFNGITVRTEGLALQRGRVGQIIRVRNLNSGKVRRARVIDASSVEVL